MADAPAVLSWLWPASWHAAIVAAPVLVVRFAVGRAVPGRWRHALWVIVLCRLVVPVLPQSPASAFNLWRPAEPARQGPAMAIAPTTLVHAWRPIADDPDVFWNVAVPAATPPRAPRWPAVAAVGWLVVAVGLTVRLVMATVRFERRLALTGRPAGAALAAAFAEGCRQMPTGRRPRLLVTEAVATPAVCGVLRPRVLVPAALADTLAGERARLVFLHELAHVRCHDVAVDWAWAIVRAVHWFNPAVWAVGPARRHDRELARDEMVLSVIGPAAAEAYGRTLLDLAATLRPTPMCPGLIGMFDRGDGRQLRQRVEAIARFRGRRTAAVSLGVAVLVVAAVCLLTSPPPRAPTPPVAIIRPTTAATVYRDNTAYADPDQPSAAAAATAALLDRRLPELRFNANALSDVFDFLRDVSGANLYVDWKSLEAAGVARDAPVTARLRDVKFSKALELIFKAVEGDKPDQQLGYAVDEGVITITTRRELNKNTVTRRYDINDLLFVPQDYPNTSDSPAMQKPADRIAEIVRYIEQNVTPNSWKEAGGEAGSISTSTLRAILLITQTPENHVKIESVLDSLRASQGLQVSVQVRVVTLAAADVPRVLAKVKPSRDPLAPAKATLPGTMLSQADADAIVAAAGTYTTAPRLTVFSGQRAALSATTDQAYVSAYTTLVRPGGTTAYEPIQRSVTTGLNFTVLAAVSPDRGYVFVDLHPTVTRLAGLIAQPWAGAPAAGSVQRPVVLTSAMATSCSIPDGATMLFGCGGFAPAATEPAVTDPAVAAEVDRSRAMQVFLLVQPRVLIQASQKTFPLLDKPAR